MSLFDMFKQPDMNTGVEEFKKSKNAILLDVRTAEEYSEGHIEGSVNIPLQSIQNVRIQIPDLNRKIYVHCLSGSRSARAASMLKAMGYLDVTNIGGIGSYTGKVVKG
ncbi:MAG: rhodanese-like domain-containing protein [Lachnospiraceae bacterium]